MTAPLDDVATRAAAALDRAAAQRAAGLAFEGLERRRRARHRRRGATGTALVLGLVAVAVVLMRPGPDGTTVLERPTTTPTPVEVEATAPAGGDAADTREVGWRPLPAAPLRAGFGAAAAWTGEEFVVWGGYAGGGTPDEESVADAAAYDPADDRWRELPDAPIPGAHGGVALWTGDEVWVLGGFGGEAGRQGMRGAAAYHPAADRWRVLPELPEPGVMEAAWLQTAAGVVTSDGALWTLGPDDDAWVQRTSPTVDLPFRAASGDGAVLVVAENGLHTLTAASADAALESGNQDLLGLDPSAQDQRMGVASTVVEGGDPSIDTISTVVIGATETRVRTLGASLHWRVEDPPTARFLDTVHLADERRVIAVDGARSGHLEMLDLAGGGWEDLTAPPHDPGHGAATAAGGGMVFTWAGASRINGTHNGGGLLTLPPADPLPWPPGRGEGVVPSFTATPMPQGLPADLHPDPGPVPPVIAPPAMWAVRSTTDGTPVLVQHTNDPAEARSIPLPGPALTALAWSDVIWAAGPGGDAAVRIVQATWQEIVPHVSTTTVPFGADPTRPLRIAPTADGAWISGLLDDDGDPLIIRIDQATGDITAQITTPATAFPASGPDEVLLVDDATLTRAGADDLTPIVEHPLPEALGQVTRVWDDRGITVLLGRNVGDVRMWIIGEEVVRELQLPEPVAAADARPYEGWIALATADGAVEVIHLSDPGPGQLLDTDHDAAVRHIRLDLGMQVDVTHSDGHTTTHTVPTK